MSYLNGVYFKPWFLLVITWSAEDIEKRITQTKEKHWKVMRKRNGEYKESQITTINNLWFYLLYQKLYFARKHSSKKVVYTITSYLQFFALQGIWNAVMIRQSSYGFVLVFRPHDILPQIYINRLGTATQVFITS